MVEIRLPRPDNFRLVRETLQRMGVANNEGTKLYQSCHILHKQGRYFIVHFKEMFALDGKIADISEEDYARRNRIISLLVDWKLIEMIDEIPKPLCVMSQVKIIPYGDKQNWQLLTKYEIGKKKHELR